MLRFAVRVCGELRTAIDVRLHNTELVAQLRAQKQAAEEADVAKSRFLAVASHDLRQPLHALELFVQALEDTPLPAHAHQLVGNVRRSVNSMEELFDALLDISRLDAGAVQARTESLALAELFERLSFEYAPVARQKGLSLSVVKTSVYVRSDPTLLGRIVRNLVANAVRYTERGQVTIGCRRRGAQVRIEVWDTGPGIPAEQHALVFQEFTQLASPERDRSAAEGIPRSASSATRDDRRKGLGLGLAIVERLARLLGHEVELRSELGKGSMFAVTVPRGRHDEQALLDPREDLAARFDLKGRLALVVQSNPGDRELIVERLTAWKCKVVGAASGVEMLARLGDLEGTPDLIIADEPDAAVVELLRSEFNADVPALLVRAAERGPHGVARDGLYVLHSPVRPGQLRTLINNVLHAPVEQAQRRAS